MIVANQAARDELAALGDPVSDTNVFSGPFELFDEHGEKLRGRDTPPLRTLRTGEVLRRFVMGVRFTGHPSCGPWSGRRRCAIRSTVRSPA